MDYLANTPRQKQEMLDAIGVKSVDELFQDIPESVRAHSLNLPDGMSEMMVSAKLGQLSSKNAVNLTQFLGGGFYDHYVPAAVDSILRRGEFFTAYTPYQAEASQGTLQAIYEFQTAMARLTGMEVANASLYDGGTALYEAAMMAIRITKRTKIVVDRSVNLIYRTMLRSYTSNLNIELVLLPAFLGPTSREDIRNALDDDTAAVILQNPSFFGYIDDFSDISEMAHERGALTVLSCYPMSLGILKTPGEMDADIVTGEGQSLGLPLSFGGPYLGFMATRKKFLRQMPGRIVGRTSDSSGRPGYVLTLQTREQHIRRERATSNICTNEALCALGALVYLSLMGKEGLREAAQLCANKAQYLSELLDAIPGVRVDRSAPFFNEFVCELPITTGEAISGMIEKGFVAGFPLERYYPNRGLQNRLLLAVTETRTKEELGAFANALEGLL